jgi:hypothetical protein
MGRSIMQWAPPLSPKTMVQVGEAWMPSLCSIECAPHALEWILEGAAAHRRDDARPDHA